jgi:hypothetical protein
MNIRLEPGKSEYTETEAARALGISQAQFRSLLLRHVVEEEESLVNVAIMRFRPSDLLLLSMLVEGRLTHKQSPSAGHKPPPG